MGCKAANKATLYNSSVEVTDMTSPRIIVAQAVVDGLPYIRGLGIPVMAVVAMVADGMTPEEILAEYPDHPLSARRGRADGSMSSSRLEGRNFHLVPR